jgi:membrane-bound lytic murein transglycosylase D
MNKQGMIKKHLIACSVIFVLVVISTLKICSKSLSKPAAIVSTQPTKLIIFPTKLIIFTNANDANDFSFANEALPINDKRVDRQMQHSLMQHDYKKVQSNLLQKKAEKLFPIIEPILRFYGIPDDFKYIPLVESGLCEGISPKGAAGLWQFMPGTARTYGLKVGKNVDERLNVKKSTVAACKYIKELYVEFNSWTLAAAAYNNGEIKLEKQINRQNEDNYFRMHLNRETGAYVYNLIAMKEIISRPVKYGYKQVYNGMPVSAQQLLAYN